MKFLLIFATESEAKATLARLDASPTADEAKFLWQNGSIVLSGIGMHAAQMCVARYGKECDAILNIGFAGALNKNLSLGEMLAINHVDKYVPVADSEIDVGSLQFMRSAIPSLTLVGDGRSLVSSDFPIHRSSQRQHLSSHWDCVDMEGYGVAFAAHFLNKPCWIWKIISDFATVGGREMIQKNSVIFSEKMADYLENYLYESSRNP